MPRYVGVDGCRGGWLLVLWDPATGTLDCALAERWAEVLARPFELLAVDMPIGLAERGPRRCDQLARGLLPAGRKSSVFPPPRRPMLACGSWREAQELGRRSEGTGLSKQAWNISGKIREIDDALVPGDQARIREVHPELVFHRLNGWRPLAPKRRAEGRAERRALLAEAGLGAVARLRTGLPRATAAEDDLLDAAACALTACRLARGEAERLPADAPRDSRGLLMEIWY